MNIRQAKDEIKNSVKAYLSKDAKGEYKIPSIRQRPLLLMGPPGIGKTQIMEQIARECRIGLVSYTITHHTRQSAVGLPMIHEEEFEGKKYSVTEYTMSEIITTVYRKIRDYGQKEGILFIDEINCVSETLTPTMLQFLQCKTFGNQKIPDGWIIVAAGNPPEYNKSVKEFDMVTLDRVRYLNIEADLGVWKQYAMEQHIHSAILSYLELRPKNFYRVEADVDGLQFVTARGWEDLSSLMKVYEELDLPVNEEIIHEFIRNEEIAEDVSAYFALYQKYKDDYGIPLILVGQVKAEVYERILKAAFDERLSVVQLLLDALNRSFDNYCHLKGITDQWYEFLKEYQKKLYIHEQSEMEPQDIYDQILAQYVAEYDNAVKNDYYTKEQILIQNDMIQNLQQNCPQLSGTEMNSAKNDITQESMKEKAFNLAREGFMNQTQLLQQVETKCNSELEKVFDFMEDAFTSGQEMLIFITGLTMSKEAATFLSDHNCERYLKYNEELIAGTQKAEILKELER